ncbi:MAG TPA: hypothetical protein VGT07_16645 [Steroidobacteraceae bacterium]|nr:hypothetical protein [Steroidobacteraceae bacterium]
MQNRALGGESSLKHLLSDLARLLVVRRAVLRVRTGEKKRRQGKQASCVANEYTVHI